jgi:hypothetical protein
VAVARAPGVDQRVMVHAGYLQRVTERVAAVAGGRLDGLWLVGSAALGDFVPGRSDLDVQGVTSERLARDELAALVHALDHRALPCPARGLELVLYARDGLGDPAGPAFELNLNTGPGMARHVAFDPGEDPRFWFVLDVSIARQAGVPLAGRPPAEVLPDLPRTLVLAAAHDALEWWSAHDPAAAEVTAARTLAWLDDGVWRSKRAAAERLGLRLV